MCQRVSVIQWNPAFLSQQQTQLRYSPPQPSSIESPHSEISDSQPASPKTQFRNVLNTAQTELDNNRLLIKQINSFGLKRLFNQQAVTQPTLPKKRMKRKGPIPKLFDNERCKVCGDKASGFHYQIVSCEGCKGFFRRSILASKIYICKNRANDCMDDPYMRRRCQACRLAACYEAGMKSEFVQKVRNETSGKTSKQITELNRSNIQLTFKQVLSPLQGDLVKDATDFWTSYCNGPEKVIERLGDIPEPSSRNKQHDHERVLKRQLESLLLPRRLPQWSSDNTPQGLISRKQHFTALAMLHHQALSVLSEIISQFGRLQQSTKLILLEGSSLEMMIVRSAFLQTANGSVPSVLTGENYNMSDLSSVGIDAEVLIDLQETIRSIQSMDLDEFEYALLSVMVLMSPDRAGRISLAERRGLDTIQENLAAILQIKMQKVGHDIKYFSSVMLLVTRLRSFSEHFQQKWLRDVLNI